MIKVGMFSILCSADCVNHSCPVNRVHRDRSVNDDFLHAENFSQDCGQAVLYEDMQNLLTQDDEGFDEHIKDGLK